MAVSTRVRVQGMGWGRGSGTKMEGKVRYIWTIVWPQHVYVYLVVLQILEIKGKRNW